MTNHKKFHSIIGLIVIFNLVAGVGNWVLQPDSAMSWGAGIVTFPLIWWYVAWSLKKRPLSAYSNAERNFFVFSVFSAGIIISLAFCLRLFDSMTTFNFDYMSKTWGIATGLFLMAIGNTIPKILSPLTAKHCSGQEAQAVQRFSGWAFVLAGFAQVLFWIFMPQKPAGQMSITVVATVLALVAARYLWAMRQRQKI